MKKTKFSLFFGGSEQCEKIWNRSVWCCLISFPCSNTGIISWKVQIKSKADCTQAGKEKKMISPNGVMKFNCLSLMDIGKSWWLRKWNYNRSHRMCTNQATHLKFEERARKLSAKKKISWSTSKIFNQKNSMPYVLKKRLFWLSKFEFLSSWNLFS